MKRSAALSTIVLALGAIILAPRVGAQSQDSRKEGRFEIEKCRTIDKPGSYKLVNNLTFTSTTGTGTCLLITADFVTIDLAGFTITGPGPGGLEMPSAAAIAAQSSSANLEGIAVRNGSISNFANGIALSSANGSVIEGLRVFGGQPPSEIGIEANGIVRGNTVVGFAGLPGGGVGIVATGIVTGNFVSDSRVAGMEIGQGSTVIGNTSTNSNDPGIGIFVKCPSNVTDNTALNNSRENLTLNGDGCTNTNNVAP